MCPSGEDQVPCEETDEGAALSCYYNWIDDLPAGWEANVTPTPEVERSVIFVDPERDDSSIWALALMDDDHVERIKNELRTRNAPVIVIYNHYLYWHANLIVGFNDNVETGGCPMVEDSVDYFEEKGFTSYANAIRAHQDALGGCTTRGVFLVRDSIYDGTTEEPYYLYSEEINVADRYSKRIIELDYNWVKFLGNHAYVVHRN
jgi:hypothetical protein